MISQGLEGFLNWLWETEQQLYMAERHTQRLQYVVRRSLAGCTGNGVSQAYHLHTGQREWSQPAGCWLEMCWTSWRFEMDRKASTRGRPLPCPDENQI